MTHRWCIVSGPRTGSTWFERCIHASLLDVDSSAQKLQEFIHPHVAFDNTINLLPNNKIEILEGVKSGLKSKNDLTNHVKQVIEYTDIDQALTCRVFTQINHYSILEYINLLSFLHKTGFTLINLNRNLFDRAVSLYVATQTGIWHRIKDKNETTLVRHREVPITSYSAKVSVDIDTFIKIYEYAKLDVYVRSIVLKSLPFINVDYENIKSDVELYNIPFKETQSILKLYEEKYENKILNYNELALSVLKYQNNK